MSPASQYIALSHVLLHFFTCLVSVKSTVLGTEGENVTLLCRYDARYHGRIGICWGRGDLPNRGCNNEIITTDGDRITSRKSSRYQLLGDLSAGNVSLTILNSILSDTGKYSCRIHVPGWFNDEKYTRTLVVNKAPTPSSHVISSSTTSGPPVTESHTTAHHQNLTTTTFTYTPQYSEVEGPLVSHDLRLLLAAVVLSLVVVATIVMTIFLIRKRWEKSQSFQSRIQSSDNAVIYSNTGGSSLGLFSREMAVENIYQLDDSDVYEEFNPA